MNLDFLKSKWWSLSNQLITFLALLKFKDVIMYVIILCIPMWSWSETLHVNPLMCMCGDVVPPWRLVPPSPQPVRAPVYLFACTLQSGHGHTLPWFNQPSNNWPLSDQDTFTAPYSHLEGAKVLLCAMSQWVRRVWHGARNCFVVFGHTSKRPPLTMV